MNRLPHIAVLFILPCLSLPLLADELSPELIANPKGDGADGKGNTADDTWQFWFELAHKRGTYKRLTLHTKNLTDAQRKNGIRGKVTGPVASAVPNPKTTEGWILHTDWDGRFEGVWADSKTGSVLLHPYVEKGSHCAVALTYKVPKDGKYTVTGKLTDVQVNPGYHKHDGVIWKLEAAQAGEKGRELGKGGPIGDGHGRPDKAEFTIKSIALKKGELIRLVIHPNKWWGRDLTRIDSFKVVAD